MAEEQSVPGDETVEVVQPVAQVPPPVTQAMAEDIPAPTTTAAKVTEEVEVEKKQAGPIVALAIGTLEELEDLIVKNKEMLKDENLVKDPSSFIVNMVRLMRGGVQFTAQASMNNELLNEEGILFTEEHSKTATGGRYGKDMRGKQAELAFTAKLRGLKKVYLYNSGFYVVIRPWTLGELNMFFQSVDMEDNTLGNLLGYYRFTIQDAFVKKSFMEIFPSCVVISNLKGWANGNHLVNNISFNDYDTLLWAVCSMMYKEPIPTSIHCLDDQCRAVVDGEYDLSRMCLLNHSVLGKEAFEFIHADNEVDADMLREYRNTILGGNTGVIDTITKVRYKLAVPLMNEYLAAASQTIADLIGAVNGTNNVKNRTLANQIIIQFNRNYIPWISEIQMLENDKVVLSTSDKSTYGPILERLGHDDSNADLHEALSKFMRDSQAVIIGYTPQPCSACGKTIGVGSGYVALDVEKLFFDLTYQALYEIGLSLN
jgi:hypothetical protein